MPSRCRRTGYASPDPRSHRPRRRVALLRFPPRDVGDAASANLLSPGRHSSLCRMCWRRGPGFSLIASAVRLRGLRPGTRFKSRTGSPGPFVRPIAWSVWGYTLFRRVRKLRPELIGESTEAIAERARRGEVVSTEVSKPEICFPRRHPGRGDRVRAHGDDGQGPPLGVYVFGGSGQCCQGAPKRSHPPRRNRRARRPFQERGHPLDPFFSAVCGGRDSFGS